MYRGKGVRPIEIDDLVIKVLEDLCPKKILKFRGRNGNQFYAWVMVCARNSLSDYFRRKDILREAIYFTELYAVPAPQPLSEEEEWRKARIISMVWDAVKQLSETLQNVVAIYLRGAEIQEIAQELNIAVGTARTRKSRALAELEQILIRDPRFEVIFGSRHGESHQPRFCNEQAQ